MKIIDKLLTVNHGGKRTRTDGVVLHSTGSRTATSQHGWFSNPKAQASSHRHVADDGVVERYVRDDQIAWANGAGNARMLAIETQGDGTTSWTPQQVESIAQCIAEWHLEFGFPLRLMTSSKTSERGIGYHRLGVPPSRWAKGLWLIAGGERWSSAVGKVCPGDKRIDQVPDVIARAKAIVGDTSPTTDKPKPSKPKAPKVVVYTLGSSGTKVSSLQRQLNKIFPTYSRLAVDGHYGPRTAAVVREFQRRAGLVPDGHCGPLTQTALRRYGIKL